MEFKSKITAVENYKDEHNHLQIIKFEKPKEFAFVPGQFVMMACDDYKLWGNPNALKWASFSLASANYQKFIELCIRVHDTPGVTNHIGTKKSVGDEINFKGPFGNFNLKKDFREIVFVALGTGIAPLISMIRTLLNENDSRPITLFYGFRNKCCFLYDRELNELQAKHKNFRLYFIASDPEQGWDAPKGFVQDLITDTEFDSPKEDLDFYMCGPPKALESIKDFLFEKGFNKEKIFFEKWG